VVGAAAGAAVGAQRWAPRALRRRSIVAAAVGQRKRRRATARQRAHYDYNRGGGNGSFQQAAGAGRVGG
jgi:hypothetical protein